MQSPNDNRADQHTLLFDQSDSPNFTAALTDRRVTEDLRSRMVYEPSQLSTSVDTPGSRPLLDAAGPLLAVLTHIRIEGLDRDIQALRDTLTEAISRYEAQSRQFNILEKHWLTGRYVLCTALDEAIHNAEGEEKSWSKKSLLGTYHNETFGGKRFFDLLDDHTRTPLLHLPLLELMYLCLALGFEGMYAGQTLQARELDERRRLLYQQIVILRGEPQQAVSPHWQQPAHQGADGARRLALPLIALFTSITLGVLYTGFAWVLADQRDATLQPFITPAALTSSLSAKELLPS